MQATVSRTVQASQTLFLALVLLVGLVLGGVGGYLVNDLSRAVSASASASQPNAPDAISQIMTRHAAIERAEASPFTPADFAASVARHSAQERAEASSTP